MCPSRVQEALLFRDQGFRAVLRAHGENQGQKQPEVKGSADPGAEL